MATTSGSAGQGSEDVARIQAMLREAGITDYEPRVISQLLDVAYASTAQLLTKARAVSQHCGKMVVDKEDIEIALDFSGLLTERRPDRARILAMAQEKNQQPLPQIRHNFGLKLPNDRFCLLQPNVEWRGSEPQVQPMMQPPIRQEAAVMQQLRPEHAVNLLGKRKAEDDFDS